MKTIRNPSVGVVMTLSLMAAQNVPADAIDAHPAVEQLKKIFAAPAAADFQPTGVTHADYLKLIAANVDFFKAFQNAEGAIIDPVSNGERQYSTPAFAFAAGLLAKDADRKDLLEPAAKAMSCALTALIEKRAADKHSDFYIPLLIHAYRALKNVAPAQQVEKWAVDFAKINPETMYRADLRGMNWNVVSSSGELLRRKDGLVANEQLAAQMKYLEMCLAGHMKTLTPLGLFEDPGAPMAYDAFSRLWLEDVYADDAYSGAQSGEIRSFLRMGGLSTLLLLSPTGEWASGGRSALHNWNEAEIAVICEINAASWKKEGRDDVAGAFKRAAHLAFQSVARWQRPGGEIWIIKNRAEPQARLAYEAYSHHSQYNLLPMAMLAIAYSRADEAIVERPSPSEVGGYVFDVCETFHKVAAAAGGYYVLIDTAADPHYNGTGLQRVHRAGVPFPALSDSAAGDRAYGPAEAPKAAVTPGIEWKSADGRWIGLADFYGKPEKATTQPAEFIIGSADLSLESDRTMSADRVAFNIVCKLAASGGAQSAVSESYVITPDGVDCTSTLQEKAPVDCHVRFPMLVSDGAQDTMVKLSRNVASVSQRGSTTTIELPLNSVTDDLKLDGPRIVTHNGYVQKAVATIEGATISYRITLSQAVAR